MSLVDEKVLISVRKLNAGMDSGISSHSSLTKIYSFIHSFAYVVNRVSFNQVLHWKYKMEVDIVFLSQSSRGDTYTNTDLGYYRRAELYRTAKRRTLKTATEGFLIWESFTEAIDQWTPEARESIYQAEKWENILQAEDLLQGSSHKARSHRGNVVFRKLRARACDWNAGNP